MLGTRRQRTLDVNLQLRDGTSATSSGAAQVGGSARILDLGGPVGPTAGMAPAPMVGGEVLVDVTEVIGVDIVGVVTVQVSSSPSFASDIMNVGHLDLSAAANQKGSGQAPGVGRYFIGVTNWTNQTTRRYMRIYHTVTGTSPRLGYTAWFCRHTSES